MRKVLAGFIISAIVLATSCKKEVVKQDITMVYPANFPPSVYNFSDNPITTAGFELGRKLFYDPRLSRDNTISCGSCHQQFASFVHAGHSVSHGIEDRLGTRNSPAIVNMAWSTHFFWDGGVHNLDLFPPSPIENHVEMDESFSNVLNKLRQTSEYPALFKSAFGTEEINSVRFLQAMSQFMNRLVSANSRYDKYVRNEGEQLTPSELDGLLLFRAKCAACHSTDLFTDGSFHNNGINATFSDSGRYRITLNYDDIGKFKTPTLRNIAKTAPYMHNGQFTTLERVLEHYNSGVRASATLDPLLNNNGIIGIPLTDDEKQKIIAFLQTLTDDEFLRDPRFSEQ